MRRARQSRGRAGPTLFDWRAANDIEKRRAELAARINGLPPHSHRRLALEERLRQATAEALRRDSDQKQESRP